MTNDERRDQLIDRIANARSRIDDLNDEIGRIADRILLMEEEIARLDELEPEDEYEGGGS